MQNHYIIHKIILRSSHSFVEYGTPTSLKAPLEGSWRLSRLRGGFFYFLDCHLSVTPWHLSFVGATIGRTLSHILSTRAAN